MQGALGVGEVALQCGFDSSFLKVGLHVLRNWVGGVHCVMGVGEVALQCVFDSTFFKVGLHFFRNWVGSVHCVIVSWELGRWVCTA